MSNTWRQIVFLIFLIVSRGAGDKKLRGSSHISTIDDLNNIAHKRNQQRKIKIFSRKSSSKKRSKKKSNDKKFSKVGFPIAAVALFPFFQYPIASFPAFAEPDPNCACNTRRGENNHHKLRRNLQAFQDFDDEIDDNTVLTNPFLPQSPEEYTERYCRCQCFCEDFDLFAVFRNETTGQWTNDDTIAGPFLINPNEVGCGCIDPTPYLTDPNADDAEPTSPTASSLDQLSFFPGLDNISIPPIQPELPNASPTPSPTVQLVGIQSFNGNEVSIPPLPP